MRNVHIPNGSAFVRIDNSTKETVFGTQKRVKEEEKEELFGSSLLMVFPIFL